MGSGNTRTETRRTFFAWMIDLAVGVISLGLSIPLVGYVISPAFKRREASWVEVGPTDNLQTGEPIELQYTGAVKDGWRTVTSKNVVWAVKQSAETSSCSLYLSTFRLRISVGQGRQHVQMSMPRQRV
jgi:hypothetical protein